MATLRFSRRAREDLLDIWAYIAEHTSIKTADRIYDRIEQSCGRLRDNPQIGRARPEIAHDARSIVIERWVAFYRTDGRTVHIVRIIDGARDIERIDWPDE